MGSVVSIKSSIYLKALFCLGLFLSPFIFWPYAKIAFEIPRVWFVNRWIEAMLILGISSLFRKQFTGRKDGSLIILTWLFAFIAIISSLLGVDRVKSFWGNVYRGDGLFTLFHLVGLSFLLVLFWNKTWERPTVASIICGSFLVSLWTSIDALRFYTSHNLLVPQAMGGTFGQPNFLAGYLLISLPFILHLRGEAKNNYAKRFLRLVLIVQLLTIGLTLSRAGILGIVLFLIASFTLSKQKYQKLVIVGTFGLSVVLGAFFLSEILNPEQKFIAESRLRIITKGLLSVKERLLFGWGWANFDYAFKSVDWPMKLTHDVYVDKAHSTFLEILVTTGITGLSVYLLIIWRVIRRLTMENIVSKWYLLSFILYIVHSQTNVISIAEELIFWIVLGITASQGCQKEKSL